MAREPCPIEGVLTLRNPLLCHAASMVEVNNPFRSYQQVGQDKAYSGKQLPLMPFRLGHHLPGV
jgi:hypothetical protein